MVQCEWPRASVQNVKQGVAYVASKEWTEYMDGDGDDGHSSTNGSISVDVPLNMSTSTSTSEENEFLLSVERVVSLGRMWAVISYRQFT